MAPGFFHDPPSRRKSSGASVKRHPDAIVCDYNRGHRAKIVVVETHINRRGVGIKAVPDELRQGLNRLRPR